MDYRGRTRMCLGLGAKRLLPVFRRGVERSRFLKTELPET